MKIVLDAMGSDDHPAPEVEGAVLASSLYGEEIVLAGQQEKLHPLLERFRKTVAGGKDAKVAIVHAAEVLNMADKPAENARRKAQNSMAVGMDYVRSGQAQAFVTAGNTGGAMVNALFTFGRIHGVKRPALTALIPVLDGGRAVLLDIGANVDCKPEYIVQFAIMGSVYAQKVLGVIDPRIGILSNGEEAGKGTQLIKDTFPLLEKSGLNFCGNVEPKEMFAGNVDVTVTDGFTGNIFVKSSEAVMKLITGVLKSGMMSSPVTQMGALLAKPAFTKMKALLSAADVGAVPLLGIDGLVFVGHGRSDANDIVHAIGAARQAVQVELLAAMRAAISERLTVSGQPESSSQA